MAWQQTDEDLLSILAQISSIFSQFDLPDCKSIIDDIKGELENGKLAVKIDKTSINTKYKALQTKFVQEFSSTPHRTNVISILQHSMNETISKNNVEMQHVFNEPNVVEIINRRANAYRVLSIFRQVIWNGAKTDEEKMIGLSYVYMNLVDGIFRNALRICYIWEQLSRKEQVNTTTISDIDVYSIYKYFNGNRLPMHYFDGWNGYARNAIAHTTFHYDSSTNETVYEDLIANKIVRLSLVQLIDMCTKLWDVFGAIFLFTQFTRINDVCFTLCDRYP